MYHQNRSKTFEQLTFAAQAKSISAQIVALQRSIRAHFRRAQDEHRTVAVVEGECRGQIARLLARV